MITTFANNQFSVYVDGTTASIQPGTALLGNALMPWNGMRVPFGSIVSFSGTADRYVNSLLYLTPGTPPDMTHVLSAESASQLSVGWPSMSDSTSFPLAVFTFSTSDGVTPQLITYRKM